MRLFKNNMDKTLNLTPHLDGDWTIFRGTRTKRLLTATDICLTLVQHFRKTKQTNMLLTIYNALHKHFIFGHWF